MSDRSAHLPLVLLLAALCGALAALSLVQSAMAHAFGCSVPKRQSPVGDTGHVYAIPHGCVRLAVPADETKLPTVVVRQHTSSGKVVVRRFQVPDTNLDRANGSVGICGHDSAYLFFVAYPFVTVVAQELFDTGAGQRECTDFEHSLLWTGSLSKLPSLTMTWYSHRPTK